MQVFDQPFQVGPPVGGLLYSFGGFLLPFVVMGALTLLMGLFIAFALPNQPNHHENLKRTRLFSLYAYVEHVSSELKHIFVQSSNSSLSGIA